MSQGSVGKSYLDECFSKFEKRLEKKLAVLEFMDQRQKFELAKIKTNLEIYIDMFPFTNIYAENNIIENNEISSEFENLQAQFPIQTNLLLNKAERLNGKESSVAPLKLIPYSYEAIAGGIQSQKGREINSQNSFVQSDRILGAGNGRVLASSGSTIESTEVFTSRRSTDRAARSIAKDPLSLKLKAKPFSNQGDSVGNLDSIKTRYETSENSHTQDPAISERSIKHIPLNSPEKLSGRTKTPPRKGGLSPITENNTEASNAKQYFVSNLRNKYAVESQKQANLEEGGLIRSKSSVTLRTNSQNTETKTERGRCCHEKFMSASRTDLSPSPDTLRCNHTHCHRCLEGYSSRSESPERRIFEERPRMDLSNKEREKESPKKLQKARSKLKAREQSLETKNEIFERLYKTPLKKDLIDKNNTEFDDKRKSRDLTRGVNPSKTKKKSSKKKKLELSSKITAWSLKRENNTPSPSFGAGKQGITSANETLGLAEAQNDYKRHRTTGDEGHVADKTQKKKSKSPKKRGNPQVQRIKNEKLRRKSKDEEATNSHIEVNPIEGYYPNSPDRLSHMTSDVVRRKDQPTENMQNLLAELIGESFEKYKVPSLSAAQDSNSETQQDKFAHKISNPIQSNSIEKQTRSKVRNENDEKINVTKVGSRKKQKVSPKLLEAPKNVHGTKKAFIFRQELENTENLKEKEEGRNNSREINENFQSDNRKRTNIEDVTSNLAELNDPAKQIIEANNQVPINSGKSKKKSLKIKNRPQAESADLVGTINAQTAKKLDSKTSTTSNQKLIEVDNKESQIQPGSDPNSISAKIFSKKSSVSTGKQHDGSVERILDEDQNEQLNNLPNPDIPIIKNYSAIQTPKEMTIVQITNLKPEIKTNVVASDMSFSSQNKMPAESLDNNKVVGLDRQRQNLRKNRTKIFSSNRGSLRNSNVPSDSSDIPATDSASELRDPKVKKLPLKKKISIGRRKIEDTKEPEFHEPTRSAERLRPKKEGLKKPKKSIITAASKAFNTHTDLEEELKINDAKKEEKDIANEHDRRNLRQGETLPLQTGSDRLSREQSDEANTSNKSSMSNKSTENLMRLARESLIKQKMRPQIPTLRTDKIRNPESDFIKKASNSSRAQNLPGSEEFSLGLVSNLRMNLGQDGEEKNTERLELPELSEIQNIESEEDSNSWYEKLSQDLQNNPLSNMTSERKTQNSSNPKKLLTSEIMRDIEKGIEIDIPADKISMNAKLVVSEDMTDRSGPTPKSEILKDWYSNQMNSEQGQKFLENFESRKDSREEAKNLVQEKMNNKNDKNHENKSLAPNSDEGISSEKFSSLAKGTEDSDKTQKKDDIAAIPNQNNDELKSQSEGMALSVNISNKNEMKGQENFNESKVQSVTATERGINNENQEFNKIDQKKEKENYQTEELQVTEKQLDTATRAEENQYQVSNDPIQEGSNSQQKEIQDIKVTNGTSNSPSEEEKKQVSQEFQRINISNIEIAEQREEEEINEFEQQAEGENNPLNGNGEESGELIKKESNESIQNSYDPAQKNDEKEELYEEDQDSDQEEHDSDKEEQEPEDNQESSEGNLQEINEEEELISQKNSKHELNELEASSEEFSNYFNKINDTKEQSLQVSNERSNENVPKDMIREYSNINIEYPANSSHLTKEKGFDLNNLSQEKKQLAAASAKYKENTQDFSEKILENLVEKDNGELKKDDLSIVERGSGSFNTKLLEERVLGEPVNVYQKDSRNSIDTALKIQQINSSKSQMPFYDHKDTGPKYIREEISQTNENNHLREADPEQISRFLDSQKSVTALVDPTLGIFGQREFYKSPIEGPLGNESTQVENFKPITMDHGTQTEMSISQELSAELLRRNSNATNINQFYEKANNEIANKNLCSKSTEIYKKFVINPPTEKMQISSSGDTSLHHQEWKEMTKDQEEQEQIEKNRTIIPFGNLLTEMKAKSPVTYRKQTPTTTIPSLHISADHTPKSINSSSNLEIKESPLNDVFQQQEKTFHQRPNSSSIFSDTNPLKPTIQHIRNISLTKEIPPITDQSSHNTSINPVKFSLTNYKTPDMWNQNVGWKRDPNLIDIGTLEQKLSLNSELATVKEAKAKTSLERTLIFAREYFSSNMMRTTVVQQNQKPTTSIPSNTNNVMPLNNMVAKLEANRSISVPKQSFLKK